MIHEIAHLVDHIAHEHGTGPRSLGWYTEAVAVAVEDMAARMMVGQEKQAPVSRLLSDGVINSRIARSPMHNATVDSPWGKIGSEGDGGSLGPYLRGAQILRFAQQKLGQNNFSPSGMLLHQRLMARASRYTNTSDIEGMIASWGIDAIAEEIGMTAEELLEQSMLADLTDDLLEEEAIQRFGIPQVAAWDNSPESLEYFWTYNRDRVLSRQSTDAVSVKVPAGGYQYWYIPASDAHGLSIKANNVQLESHHKVQIMRLR